MDDLNYWGLLLIPFLGFYILSIKMQNNARYVHILTPTKCQHEKEEIFRQSSQKIAFWSKAGNLSMILFVLVAFCIIGFTS